MKKIYNPWKQPQNEGFQVFSKITKWKRWLSSYLPTDKKYKIYKYKVNNSNLNRKELVLSKRVNFSHEI